jgi:peptidoglycan/xylan/chitin deacetylase (PgdA/CDA1 family)
MNRRPREDRSIWESPILAAILAVVAIGLVAVIALPLLLGSAGPGASPGASGGGPLASPTQPGPTFVRPTPSPQPTFVSHVVEPGDTLSSIARLYRTTGRSIAWWNRGTYPTLDPESADYDPNNLKVGWVLRVLADSEVDENNPPPAATPGPTHGGVATPNPTATPPNPPTSGPQPTVLAGPATVISHGPRTARNIALTFDMGGRLEPAVDIVQWLIDNDVHATLFPTGSSGTGTEQGLAAMQLAATRPDLFDFANHSWDHPDFRNLTASQMADQLLRTETALRPITGTTKPWFRPPFGGWNDAVRAGVGAAGWRSIVMWDIDTIDWRTVADGGPSAGSMAATVVDRARTGSIVLMHLGGWSTFDALPSMVMRLRAVGLQPTTVTDLVR